MDDHTHHVPNPKTWSQPSVVIRFVAIFLPLILIVISGSFVLYSIEKSAMEKIIGSQEIASLDKQENLIKSDFNAIVSDLLYLATQAKKSAWLDDHDIVVAAGLGDAFLEFTRYKGIYDQVRLLGPKGMEKIRVNNNMGRPNIVPAEKLQFKGLRYYFTDTLLLGEGEVFVSPFDLNIENERIEEPVKPMIRFGTPIYDNHGAHLGVIILNYLGSKLNNKLRKISNAVPGSNMLLNPEGYWIISPIPEDEWGFMYADRLAYTYGNRYPEIWRQLNNKKTGQFFNSGNLYTFNTIYPLEEALKSSTGAADARTPSARPIGAEDYYWILLSSVPNDVFAKELAQFMSKLIFIDGLLIIVLGMGAWLVASAHAKRDELFKEKQLLIDELQGALANIHTLSGLIPICSSCKNIRDDKGYWSRIESYITERSEAIFSHSICPTCTQKLYPDLFEDKKKK